MTDPGVTDRSVGIDFGTRWDWHIGLMKNTVSTTRRGGRRHAALYAEYVRPHDYLGGGANDVMHRLGEIKRVATTR